MELTEERLHADTFATRVLSQPDLTTWSACRSGHRFMAFQGKELMIYQLFEGKPEIQDILTCRDVSLTFKGGLITTWVNQNRDSLHIGHAPVQVQPGVFMWHVFDSQIQYIPYQGRFSARLPLAYRTMRNPQIKQDGVNYILERAVYESMFGNR